MKDLDKESMQIVPILLEARKYSTRQLKGITTVRLDSENRIYKHEMAINFPDSFGGEGEEADEAKMFQEISFLAFLEALRDPKDNPIVWKYECFKVRVNVSFSNVLFSSLLSTGDAVEAPSS